MSTLKAAEPTWQIKTTNETPTIRQQFIIAAMQGILSSYSQTTSYNPDWIAEQAILIADACIKIEKETR